MTKYKERVLLESLKNQIKKSLPTLGNITDKENVAKIVKKIYDLDPTAKDGEGEQFAGGFISMYSEKSYIENKLVDIDKFIEYIKKYFDYYQNLAFNSYGLKKKKSNQFADIDEFYKYVDDIENKVSKVDNDEGWKEIERDFPLIYKDKDWVVFYVDNRDSGIKTFGGAGNIRKTSWCVFGKESEWWDKYMKVEAKLFLFYKLKSKKEPIESSSSEKISLCAMADGITSMGASGIKGVVYAFEINNLINQTSKYANPIRKLILKNKKKFIENVSNDEKLNGLESLFEKYNIAHDITWWLEHKTPKNGWTKVSDRLLWLNIVGAESLRKPFGDNEIEPTRFIDNNPVTEGIVSLKYYTFYDIKRKEFLVLFKLGFLSSKGDREFYGLESSLHDYEFVKDDFENMKEAIKQKYLFYKESGVDEKATERYKKYLDSIKNLTDKFDTHDLLSEIDPNWFKEFFKDDSDSWYIIKEENEKDFLDWTNKIINTPRTFFYNPYYYDKVVEKLERSDIVPIVKNDPKNMSKKDYENFYWGTVGYKGILTFNNFDDILVFCPKLKDRSDGTFILNFILAKNNIVQFEDEQAIKSLTDIVKRIYFDSGNLLSDSIEQELSKFFEDESDSEITTDKDYRGVTVTITRYNKEIIQKIKDMSLSSDLIAIIFKNIKNEAINIDDSETSISIPSMQFVNCKNLTITLGSKDHNHTFVKKSKNIKILLKKSIDHLGINNSSDVIVDGNNKKIDVLSLSEINNNKNEKIYLKSLNINTIGFSDIDNFSRIFFDDIKLKKISISGYQESSLIIVNMDDDSLNLIKNNWRGYEHKIIDLRKRLKNKRG